VPPKCQNLTVKISWFILQIASAKFKTDREIMTISDFILIGKKILVGIIVTLIPLAILLGGIYLVQELLK
jgi:hypothetical protein